MKNNGMKCSLQGNFSGRLATSAFEPMVSAEAYSREDYRREFEILVVPCVHVGSKADVAGLAARSTKLFVTLSGRPALPGVL